MADAAVAMLVLTQWQIVVGLLGIVGLAWTVHYTRATANAAVAAIQLAENTAERQLRAYVGPTRVYFQSFTPGARASVIVEIKNFGQTPARDYNTALWLEFHPHPLLARLAARKPVIAYGDETLMPSKESVVICETADPVSDAEHAAILNGTCAIFLVGAIAYKDVFGKSQRTNLRKFARGERVGTTSPFVNTDEGNDAT